MIEPRLLLVFAFLIGSAMAGCAARRGESATAVRVEPSTTATRVSTPAASAPPAPVSGSPSSVPAPSAMATSRGPDLEATDPRSVSLDSGELQLIEFFRFT